MTHKRNTIGLVPFKKGQSGNPSGKPKLPKLEDILDEVLGETVGDAEMTAAKAVVLKLRQLAVKGDIRAINALLDRAYGKARERIDITTGGEPITAITYSVKREKS